jgi:phosphatidylglycerol lysyltransferase
MLALAKRFYRRLNFKALLQYGVAIFFLAAAVFFFYQEIPEIRQFPAALGAANAGWLAIGGVLVVFFVFVQGFMYWYSFQAVGTKVRLSTAILLFLKRNFVAVFLPAGNFTSLAFFNGEVERRDGIAQHKTVVAGIIHGIASFASIAVAAVPVIGLLLFHGGLTPGILLAFGALLLLIGGMLWIFFDALRGGAASQWVIRRFPGLEQTAQTLQDEQINWKSMYAVLLWSCVIEAIGIAHLYVSMWAISGHGDWMVASVGYVVVLLWLSISPVLRGLGGVEVSLALVLTAYDFPMHEALSITILFRIFEFWGMLALGAGTFLRGTESFLLRLGAPVFIFILGIVNIISAVTPALPERRQLLRDFLPHDLIHQSNFLVLTAGLALLLTAVHLFRGLVIAWWVAVVFTGISILGHLTKGIDYEEAILGAVTMFALLYTRKQYFIKTDRRKTQFGLFIFGATLVAAFLYGFLGFCYLDVKMFGWDFTVEQSAGNTIRLFFLMDPPGLVPLTKFAVRFMSSISFAGMLAMLTGIYFWMLPFIYDVENESAEFEEATDLVKKYGKSCLDYYKTYFDKRLFFTGDRQSFIAYKIARNYAVVLDMPVAPSRSAQSTAILEFELFCRESGLQSIYYRVDKADLSLFNAKRRKSIMIGQEATLDLTQFSLEGKPAKSLRNAVSRCEREGLVFTVYVSPVPDGLLQKLRAVSDAWLNDGKREIAFSGGIFNEKELKEQTIVTVESNEGKILAFANLVPDFAPGEATYDLMRRLPDAPGYAMDFLMVSLFEYLKSQGYQSVNMGMVPMSGVSGSRKLPERALQFATDRLKTFAHYQGLKAYKEKFATHWSDKFLVYGADYDLISAPAVLAEVEKTAN